MELYTEKTDELEIDLRWVYLTLKRRIWRLVLASVICAAVAVCCLAVVPREYQAGAVFCTVASDASAARSAARSCMVVLQTRQTLTEAAQEAQLLGAMEVWRESIRCEILDSTEFFRVTVTGEDPGETEAFLNGITQVLPGRVHSLMDGISIVLADPVSVAEPVEKDYGLCSLLGLLSGFLGSCIWIILEAKQNEKKEQA